MKKIFGFYLSFLLAFLSIQVAFASDEQAIEEVVMRGSSLKRSVGIEDLWAVDATDAIEVVQKYAMASDSQTWAATNNKITICDFEKHATMLSCVYRGLYDVLTEEEFDYVDETHTKLTNGEIQDCSILDPYLHKINALCYYEEDLQELGISHLFPFTNEFFAQFPNLEAVRIETNQSQVPETLFHGLPHLKVVEIRGNNIEILPTDLFKQNNQLLEFDMLSDSFRGVSDPKFFRNIPLLEELGMPVHRPDVIWHAPDDLCTYNKHLVNIDLGRARDSRTPSSCCTPRKLKIFEENGDTGTTRGDCASIRD